MVGRGCFVVTVVVIRKNACACGMWVWVSGNNIGEEGAKALGPHLGKLVNMNTLGLGGKSVLGMRVRGAR